MQANMPMRMRDSVVLIGLILAATVQVATGQTAADNDRPCRSITHPLA
jgi:hypothetical protein